MKKENIFMPVLIFILVSIIFCMPLFHNFNYWGQRNWDESFFWNDLARKSILYYHQFPLWNPYSRGGIVFLGHPHFPFLSPMFMFVLLFGAVTGLKIELVIYLFLGLLGMYVLSRFMGLSKVSSYLCALVYNLSSIYPLHLREGHFEWMIMGLLPWFFFAYLKTLKNKLWIIPASAIFSLFIAGGSVDVISISVTFFGVYSLFYSLKEKKAYPIIRVISIFLCTLLLMAVKILPMYNFLNTYPRFSHETDGVNLKIFFNMLLNRNQLFLSTQPYNFFGTKEGWHEYGAYIGIVPLIFALIGIFCYFKRHWPLVFTGLICFLLTMGNSSFINLWGILHSMPIYNMLTVPSRYILGVILCIAIFSGFGLETIKEKAHFKPDIFKKGIIIAIVLFIAIDLFMVSSPIFRNIFTIPPKTIFSEGAFFQGNSDLIPTNTIVSNLYPSFLMNKGTVDGCEPMLVNSRAKSVKDNNYKGEAYLINNMGQVRLSDFTPNEVIVKVSVSKTDNLVLNQNYYKGWRIVKNGKMFRAINYNGLIASEVEPGVDKIIFVYLPDDFKIGLFVSIISIALCLFLLLKSGKHLSHILKYF